MKQTKNPISTLIFIAQTLFVFLFVFFMYTFLHEAGHTLAGWFFGQSLTEFDVSFWDLSAHVGLTGGNLTQTQLALQSAAGTLLPFLVWVIFISFVPRRGSFILEELKLISSMVVINTFLTWIILPILFMAGKAPSDDVTNSLSYSQISPLFLSFIAILFYASGWILFLSKIDGLRNEFLIFRNTDPQQLFAGTRRIVPVMSGILVFCVFLTVGFNITSEKNSSSRFTPPSNFASVAQIDLSSRPYSSEAIAEFQLDQTSYAGVYITVRDIDTKYFDLRVAGSDGSTSVVLHGEGYRVVQDGGLWEKRLLPGTYRLMLTSSQSSGTASIYLKTSMP